MPPSRELFGFATPYNRIVVVDIQVGMKNGVSAGLMNLTGVMRLLIIPETSPGIFAEEGLL